MQTKAKTLHPTLVRDLESIKGDLQQVYYRLYNLNQKFDRAMPDEAYKSNSSPGNEIHELFSQAKDLILGIRSDLEKYIEKGLREG